MWVSRSGSEYQGVQSDQWRSIHISIGRPPGRYDLKVFDDALDGRKSVSMDVLAETTFKADSCGKYSLSIDTWA
jgi:hypothetical protein